MNGYLRLSLIVFLCTFITQISSQEISGDVPILDLDDPCIQLPLLDWCETHLPDQHYLGISWLLLIAKEEKITQALNEKSDLFDRQQIVEILHLAVALGRLPVLKLLQAKFADQIALQQAKLKNGNHLLHTAAKFKQIAVMRYLLAQKVVLNAKNKQGRTPLHIAIRAGAKDIVTLLLAQSHIDLNKMDRKGRQVLHEAVLANDLQLVKTLVGMGANLATFDKKNRLPVDLALLYEDRVDEETAEFLLEKTPGCALELCCQSSFGLLIDKLICSI